ncbi:MAG TPA: ribonuclease III [Oligoflexia bacterium]|nr:ribonuclease III [Oligoflexia bacterium]HMP27704.1 ribonuclease III [Oligoflexia bacterium]
MNDFLLELQQKIGINLLNPDLLIEALTHPSFKGASNYQRLEFLGDAVIANVISLLLFRSKPLATEGELSKARSGLVNTKNLAKVARLLELDRYIRLSAAEAAANTAKRDKVLEDVLESIFGAVFIDQGFEAAYCLAQKLFADQIDSVQLEDFKTELQEMMQSLGKELPSYLVEDTSGPEHAKKYLSVAKIGGEVIGRGQGSSKKASEQEAAKDALSYFKAKEKNKRR